MIVTEEEAKTRRCQESFGPVPQQATTCNAPVPGGLFYMSHPGGAGVYPYMASPTNCLGSACMAWRWIREDSFEKVGSGPLEIRREGQGPSSTTHGYCGKASRP